MVQGKIRRGELDRQVTFIKEVVSRGTSNQDTVTSWTEVTTNPTVFARRREMQGNEIVIADQLQYVQKTEFIVGYRTDITTKNRLVFNGRVYEIISVIETEERKAFLQIMANLLDTVVWT